MKTTPLLWQWKLLRLERAQKERRSKAAMLAEVVVTAVVKPSCSIASEIPYMAFERVWE